MGYIFAGKSHRFVAKSVQLNKAFYAAGCFGHVLYFLSIRRGMIGRKETNDSLEKKKSTRLDLAAKQLSFPCFRCFRFENG